VAGIACVGLNGGPHFRHSEAFSFQVLTDDPAETDRLWHAFVANGGHESDCGWCMDRRGMSRHVAACRGRSRRACASTRCSPAPHGGGA